MKKKYIHYGSDKFDPDRFEDISNWEDYHTCKSHLGLWSAPKPHGGLWAAPINPKDSWGWKEWCETNEFHTERLAKSFEFTLTDNAKVLYLNDMLHEVDTDEYLSVDKSIEKAVHINDYLSGLRRDRRRDIEDLALDIDFYYLKNVYHYDAIEVKIDSIFYWLLYGWDVDSLLVLNPDCIVVK